jgi:hypothetical protein
MLMLITAETARSLKPTWDFWGSLNSLNHLITTAARTTNSIRLPHTMLPPNELACWTHGRVSENAARLKGELESRGYTVTTDPGQTVGYETVTVSW